MTSQRWDPLRDIVTLREAMNSLLEESFVRPRAGVMAMTNGMALDLRENDAAFTVETVLPGIKPENVEISILNDTLRVTAESVDEGDRDGEKWLVRERRYGRFERSITLPSAVQAEEANAEFENGILTITLPKAEQERPRTIQVKQAQAVEAGQQGETEIPVDTSEVHN